MAGGGGEIDRRLGRVEKAIGEAVAHAASHATALGAVLISLHHNNLVPGWLVETLVARGWLKRPEAAASKVSAWLKR